MAEDVTVGDEVRRSTSTGSESATCNPCWRGRMRSGTTGTSARASPPIRAASHRSASRPFVGSRRRSAGCGASPMPELTGDEYRREFRRILLEGRAAGEDDQSLLDRLMALGRGHPTCSFVGGCERRVKAPGGRCHNHRGKPRKSAALLRSLARDAEEQGR